MQEFIEKNAGYDVRTKLEEVQHRIAIELFNISRVVDDGNFHTHLPQSGSTEIRIIYDIPIVCKVNLEGMLPPLHVKVNGLSHGAHKEFKAFMSYKNTEPSAAKCEQEWS